MDNSLLELHSRGDSDLSTGYLQDDLFEFVSKRRRLLFFSNHQTTISTIESNWNYNDTHNEYRLDRSNNVFPSSAGGVNINEKSRSIRVCPFGVVKAGGEELSLEDINKRIVKPPTRPLRHPVGEFACNCRRILHPLGTGKVVVALTTIQTQGRGSITIIRTKG